MLLTLKLTVSIVRVCVRPVSPVMMLLELFSVSFPFQDKTGLHKSVGSILISIYCLQLI
jgi:hypothetical protein